MLTLVMNPGLPEEQIFPLREGFAVSIGRTKDNGIFCLHKSLSRKHAQVEVDGTKVRVSDLQSKNGVFFDGKRVAKCDVGEGGRFRCGDITFLVEGGTAESPGVALSPPDGLNQTLPSPTRLDTTQASRRPPVAATAPKKVQSEEDRSKERLFLLIRASELCASDQPIERVLDDLIVLAVQAFDLDRIALLALDDVTLQVHPRVLKSFVAGGQYPYSHRVVDWVIEHGTPASYADVARDRTLPGDASFDVGVKGAMCVPMNPGDGTIGVIYVDSLTHADCYRPDDLALLRAIANLAALALDLAARR